MLLKADLMCSEGITSLSFRTDENFEYANAQKPAYQDRWYTLALQFDDKPHIEVFLNNKRLNVNYSESTSSYRTTYDNFFSTLYGFCQFHIIVTRDDSSEIDYWLEYLVVAIKNDMRAIDIERSIAEMIDIIYNEQYDLLYHTGSPQRTIDEKRLGESEFKTLDADITYLSEIVKTYTKYISFFTNNPYYKTTKKLIEDDFNKINTINSQVINYIVSHQEQLSISSAKEGFKLGRKYYYPEKSLVEKFVAVTDVYENQLIVGFIKYISFDIKRKKDKIKLLLSESPVIDVELNDDDDEYILSSSVINKLTQFRLKEYLKKLISLEKDTLTIYNRYKHILPCTEIRISPNFIPQPTNIIYAKQHYRAIYDTILRWFKSGVCNYDKEKVFLNFITADQIYEYYCLVSIANVLKRMGLNLRETRHIKYEMPDYRYIETSVNNFYMYSNDVINAVLYYQPVIYSAIEKNKYGIGMFRVDQNYYTPDFIIKISTGTKEQYLILDSKWSDRSTIKNNYYSDVMFKYAVAIKRIDSIYQNNSVWILQGKNDNSPSSIDHLNKKMPYSSNENELFKWQYGILTLTPQSKNDDLYALLSAFIHSNS